MITALGTGAKTCSDQPFDRIVQILHDVGAKLFHTGDEVVRPQDKTVRNGVRILCAVYAVDRVELPLLASSEY